MLKRKVLPCRVPGHPGDLPRHRRPMDVDRVEKGGGKKGKDKKGKGDAKGKGKDKGGKGGQGAPKAKAKQTEGRMLVLPEIAKAKGVGKVQQVQAEDPPPASALVFGKFRFYFNGGHLAEPTGGAPSSHDHPTACCVRCGLCCASGAAWRPEERGPRERWPGGDRRQQSEERARKPDHPGHRDRRFHGAGKHASRRGCATPGPCHAIPMHSLRCYEFWLSLLAVGKLFRHPCSH